MLIIAKNIDGIVPNQGKWHSDLLFLMFKENGNRPAVFSGQQKNILSEYMNFRHFFRHSYGYSMKWEKLKHLFLNPGINWNETKAAIEEFIQQ